MPQPKPRLRIFPLLDGDPAPPGELLHGLYEGEAFLLLHELDGIAGLATTEAVVESTVRLYVERRRLFMVERTTGLVA